MSNRIRIFSSLLFVLAFLFPPTAQVSAVDYPINVWPKPRIFSWPKPQAALFSMDLLTIIYPRTQALHGSLLRRHFDQFKTEEYSHYSPLVSPLLNLTSSTPLGFFTITVNNWNAQLTQSVNESYTLSVPCPSTESNDSTAILTAETVWGAIRGLQSFSQLIYGNPTRVACGLYISDEPLYRHRGILLDTSRHYYGVPDLLRLIKAMSMNKLNVFHWHITDSQSFPLVLPSELELARKGAYGEEMIYSQEDVRKVVEFGIDHGVRVVPEIDMPGKLSNLKINKLKSVI